LFGRKKKNEPKFFNLINFKSLKSRIVPKVVRALRVGSNDLNEQFLWNLFRNLKNFKAKDLPGFRLKKNRFSRFFLRLLKQVFKV